MKHYSVTGRRNNGRTLKRLLEPWDWNGSTSGPAPWQIYDDDDDDDDDDDEFNCDFPHFKQHTKDPINFIRVVASFVQSIVTSFPAAFLRILTAALESSTVD